MYASRPPCRSFTIFCVCSFTFQSVASKSLPSQFALGAMHDLFVHGYGIQQRYFACLSSLEKHAISHADEVAALAKVGP
jgi:hypothetical protein